MSDSFADQLPRHYQEEIFERSQRENIIAALDTGAGKTFISLLLLKWVASRQPGCKMIFLVPTVALVEQQGNFLAKSTLRITKFSGALNIDLSNRIGWSSKLEQGDLFVMTPQIFLDLLTHALWRISQFALIIFDEAHHARKSHPYAKIMKEYFEVLSTSRPKIFGMTASPVWNTKDPAASLAALEATMDATVVAVHDNLDELARLAHRATEFIKQYPPPPADYESFPSPTLWKCLTVFEEVFQRHFGLPWDGIKRRYVATLQNLGPYSASMYLYLEIRHRLVDEDDISPEIAAIQDMLMSHDSFFKLKLIPLQWCSPKIEALVQILSAHLDNSAKKFRGIIFVQQRQVAVCLARLLPCIPGLSETIRCAELVGGGQGTDGRGFDLRSVGMVRTAQDTVKAFRQGEINLLVATSVAEEGLDFPECEFVVRFDPLQNMVGYVQSRGRARSKASVFVIMVEEDDAAQMARYQVFLNQEPQLKALYSQSAQDIDVEMHEIEEPEENDQPTDLDLAQRERYVVPSTGAFLTCDNAIHLLGRLCASIPRQDSSYVSANAYAPKYSGDFEAILQLPSVLPLPRAELRFTGPRRSSKREAKRAVAWIAVKRLRELEVLDEYLLPAAVERSFEDSKIDVSHIPSEMEVLVCDPWAAADWNELWIHSIFIDDRRVAGLVTGANLPPVEFREGETLLRTSGGTVLSHSEHRLERLRAMEEFTREGIWYRITGTPLDLPLKLYIVPILESTGQPDFCAIERLLASPRGNLNWDDINEENYGHLMVRNVNLIGQFYVLQQIRDDLSPSSAPPPDSIEAEVGFSTYREYWIDKWTGKPGGQKRQPQVPESGPLLALTRLPRLNRMTKHHDTVLFPRDCCGWISISEDVREALRVLPVLCHRVTSAYRARRARLALSLPPILEGVLVEALTLPCASAGYDNQRLETLGDAVLQLCTTVYLYNRYPNWHEGQLSNMRQNRVCNRFLLSRAKEVGLESFLTCEDLSVKTWASGIQRQGADDDDDPVSVRRVRRQFPRRSLQDCMEAVLGASFVTGGIQMALHAGRGLGLDFGGPTPWGVRYAARDESPVPSTFSGLEDALGYSFRCGALLGEALTHSSVDNQMTRSYERLEFLGDAILDLVVIAYLFRKFPESNSDGLAWPRTRVICAPTLAAVGVRRLGLHRLVLINSVELGMAVERYVPELEACSAEEIVLRSWAYDPPKVLSDVFESVIGAVLVDSNYDYERTASVVEFVMQDVLEVVHPSLPRDPVSELLQWADKAGRKIVFDKPIGSSAVTVLEHGEVVAGPVASTSSAVAKNLVAEAALSVLRDRT